jgi:FkbM family methyltransferase
MSGFTASEQRRIDLTVAVRDTDHIPKVGRAGEVVTQAGRRVQVMHNGLLVDEGCYYGAWMTEIIRRLRGHHEPQEEAAFHAVIERVARSVPAPTVVELGSYWAYYSLWAAVAAPGARCICVEPDRAHLEVGRRNFELNNHSARFVHAAVGGAHGTTRWLSSESDRVVRRTPVITLDGLMQDQQLDRIDVLLSDTQGAELALLESAAATLRAGSVRFLVISTHHHTISGDPLTHQRCLEAVRAGGAHVVADHSVSESCSGDGLIVASTSPDDRDMQIAVSIVRARDSVFGEPEYDLERALRPSAPPRRAVIHAATRLDRFRRRSWRS